jgi:hypothetical protein
MTASQDYMENMFGTSYVSQYLKKKKKKEQEVSMSCSHEGCAAYQSGGGESDAGSKSYATKSVKGAKGEGNVVLTAKEAEKRKKEMEKFRESEKKKHTPVTKSKF